MGISTIAWGAKVSDLFLDRVKWIVDDLDIGYSLADGTSKLMACMAWESNETFEPDVRNMAGSGATGLIQFMPSTAKALGTDVLKLAHMTAEDQLNYVWKYFEPYRGRLKTLGDLYMAILWPKGVGKPETYVLWAKGNAPTTYRQNSGLDLNRDGVITKAEATAKVAEKLSKGMGPGYVLETLLTPFADEPQEQLTLDPAPEPEPEGPMDAKDVLNTVKDTAVRIGVEKGTELIEQVTEDATHTVTIEAKPKTKVEVAKHAAGSFEAKILAILMVLGPLLADPAFSSKLGAFTTSVARGETSWSALISLVGVALLVYRNVTPPRN